MAEGFKKYFRNFIAKKAIKSSDYELQNSHFFGVFKKIQIVLYAFAPMKILSLNNNF